MASVVEDRMSVIHGAPVEATGRRSQGGSALVGPPLRISVSRNVGDRGDTRGSPARKED